MNSEIYNNLNYYNVEEKMKSLLANSPLCIIFDKMFLTVVNMDNSITYFLVTQLMVIRYIYALR